MTQKQIIEIASNEDVMETLEVIASIQRNMCHKTIYERKTASAKMRQLAKEIIKTISGQEM